MGLETAAIVMAAVATGAEVAKGAMEYKSAGAKERALDLQAKEIKRETQEKTLSNYDVMEKTIEAQQAYMTTTGLAFSSPSYNAIQRNTLNIGAKKQRNIDIEAGIAERNIEFEKENVKNTLYAQLFGDAASAAFSIASVAGKMPQMKES